MGSMKMSNILTLGTLEAEKCTKQKRQQHCGTPCILQGCLSRGGAKLRVSPPSSPPPGIKAEIIFFSLIFIFFGVVELFVVVDLLNFYSQTESFFFSLVSVKLISFLFFPIFLIIFILAHFFSSSSSDSFFFQIMYCLNYTFTNLLIAPNHQCSWSVWTCI